MTIDGLLVCGIKVVRDGMQVGELRRTGGRRGSKVLWYAATGAWAGGYWPNRVDALLELAEHLRARAPDLAPGGVRVVERQSDLLGRQLELVEGEDCLAFALDRKPHWLLGPHRALDYEFTERPRDEAEARAALLRHADSLRAIRARCVRLGGLLAPLLPGRQGRAMAAEAECSISAATLFDLLAAAARGDERIAAAIREGGAP